MEEEATKAAAINCLHCNPSCNTPNFTGCAFVDALHMVWSKSNSAPSRPPSTTKTKHALQQKKEDPLSLSSPPWALEQRCSFPEVPSHFHKYVWNSVPGQVAAVLAWVRTWASPAVPAGPGGSGAPPTMPTFASAASRGGFLIMSPTRACGARAGSNLHPFPLKQSYPWTP